MADSTTEKSLSMDFNRIPASALYKAACVYKYDILKRNTGKIYQTILKPYVGKMIVIFWFLVKNQQKTIRFVKSSRLTNQQKTINKPSHGFDFFFQWKFQTLQQIELIFFFETSSHKQSKLADQSKVFISIPHRSVITIAVMSILIG